MNVAAAQRILLLLTGLRWLPVGLILGVSVLLPLERGLSVVEIGSLLAIQGFVVLGLELPTGGLSDSLGRRPVLVIAGVLAVLAGVLFVLADNYALFAVSLVVQGVFRALDSGSLEAWFVDTAHESAPDADVAAPLARASSVLGVALACGALAGGLLVAWHPMSTSSALILPCLVSIAGYACYTLLTFLSVSEAPRKATAATTAAGAATATTARKLHTALSGAPRSMRDGWRLVIGSRTLAGLIAVEVFWAIAMVAFETLTPLRLERLLGSESDAAAIFGPASAAAWALFAAGSMLAGRASRRFAVTQVAIASRLLNGLFVVAMGWAAGVVGLLVAFGLTYATHGGAGPMHAALLHREADRATRATVLSLNSMVAGGAYSMGAIALTSLAGATSVAAAIVVAGAFSTAGVVCYLPSLKRERRPSTVSHRV